MSIHAVIFDMGGVILRTEDQAGRRRWETRLGLKEGELSRVVFESDASARATIGQCAEAEVWKHVAATFNLTEAQLAELQRDFWSGDHIDAELTQFVRGLRPRYRTAILSNAWLGAREAIANKFGLRDGVDAIVISAEEGIAKPDARIYGLTAARLGVLPEQAIFVDDMPVNVQAAQALGMRGVQFKNTAQAIADIKMYLNQSA